ncbi:strawberry notch-like NTP hydrolase domain-containing protein [Asticcacaulis sp.]|uniref:strawberry notch-like NTP hydrolase domain-containing protein n=1 Tax=Asticcacaulis sp. TaxID=1872648 RepID=UPI003F7B9311
MNAMLPATSLATAHSFSAHPTSAHASRKVAEATYTAATALLPTMEVGGRINASVLRSAMQAAFRGTDAEGAWDWKTAYDACGIASVLFIRKYGQVLKRKVPAASALLPTLHKVASLLPTHTRRSVDSQTYQQFSTPLPLGWVAAAAAQLDIADLVLEPSAGTGMLAVLAEMMGAGLILNELAPGRADVLDLLFPRVARSRFDAAQIDDYLDPALKPSVILMNPPFSVLKGVRGPVQGAAMKHIRSALHRLAPGGRLVAITGASLSPDEPAWRDAFVEVQQVGRIVFSAAIDGSVYAKHGTTVETRLTVIDKVPASDPSLLHASHGMAQDVETLMRWIDADLPPRPAVSHTAFRGAALPANVAGESAFEGARSRKPLRTPQEAAGVPLDYHAADWAPDPATRLSEAIYEPYSLQSLRIPGAKPHPTVLVQSAAMSSVAPPKPSYRPHLPAGAVEAGLLSDAQLESVIYAGEAHGAHLSGWWTVDDTYDLVSTAAEGTDGALQFRRGWFLGDGTGAGKGRQSAAIILDNWLKGRRKALWISKSDKLLEDAQRDWSALGRERLEVTPLSRFKPGAVIPLDEAVLFTTYATLRSEERGTKKSRIQQIVDWLGRDFDGVIIFDEAHSMQNAGGGSTEWGDAEASQQGRAGLRLQHALPDARVVYVSATGATNVHNLAYAQRLGLWGGEDFPFANRADFIAAIENGGVAAMEVLARDLRAMGLYTARSLSYEGVEYDMLVHDLTPEQVRIYDAYADAFAIIHNHLDAAMKAAKVTGDTGTMNRQAKSAAKSAFESTKQRFFGHLLTSMKTPTLLRAIQQDLDAGHSAVIQIVSTGEALTERRLSEVPTEEWNDIQVDITPREYVLDYLRHSFPVQLYEPYSTDDGKVVSRAVYKDGQPVECRAAVAARDALIENLASLSAVPGALDQIVQHFGTDAVAEVTGRSRRIVRKGDRYVVESRPGAANLVETQAFMDDLKQILIFSEAGGTGRSYHAELSAKNQRLRVHYLLEFGWKADAAVQGLGRTNRTNQAQPPVFRPIATNVKAERRFLATIARRLDTLGALTRGQRQTGGQGLFRPEDNLESVYGRDALRQLYKMIHAGKVEGCSLQKFEQITGLRLCDENGLRDDLPPINTFLNRLLALTISMQELLFTAFEDLLSAKIEGAIAAGTYELGLETLQAVSFQVSDRQVINQHPTTGAETTMISIRRRLRSEVMTVAEVLEKAEARAGIFLVNGKTGHACLQHRTRGLLLEDGSVEDRVVLIGPKHERFTSLASMADSHWRVAERATFIGAWEAEVATIPEFAEDTLHVVSGLLLPIWNRLPGEGARVYRLQTDEGERIVGRCVSAAWVANASAVGGVTLEPADAHAALMEGKTILSLAEGLQLRRVRVMGSNRIELSGFTDSMRDRLKAYGLFHEIITWKLRMFVPVSAEGIVALGHVLGAWPIERVSEKEAG